MSDLEFVQFHPTVLFLGADAEGQQPLVSEAVRGEGAHLVDADGVRFMLGQHELAELAPRDIVAKGIMRRMRENDAEHMYLDARHFGAEMWERRFPTILAACRAHGIDPVTEPVPVAPAAHYASGGVRTDDSHGRTTVPGLYACGEVACTGVHGANRLASNSLLEGLVYAERIAADILRTGLHARVPQPLPTSQRPAHPLLPPEARFAVQRIMTRGAGVLRPRRPWPRPPTACTGCTPTRATPSTRTARPPSRASTPGRPPTCCASPVSWWRGPAARGDPRLPLA